MNKNHRRIISARFKIIGRNIEEIIQIAQNSSHSALEPAEDLISDEDSEKLLMMLNEVSAQLEDIMDKYRLPVQPRNQKSMIIARLSEILDTVIDLHSEKLKGYGDFNGRLESSYNHDIDELERKINKALQIF